MASKSRFLTVKQDIVAVFESRNQRVYRASELKQLVAANRGRWRLGLGPDLQEFVDLMTATTVLQSVQVQLKGEKKTLYTWGSATMFEIAASLLPRAYLSHHTALYLHGLIKEIPKQVFINQEQSLKAPTILPLTQEDVDTSFARPQMESSNRGVYGKYSFVLLSGKHAGQLGVATQDFPAIGRVPVTDLERTLIDITVRPDYAGGVQQVLQAYQRAAGTVSINRLLRILAKLAYRYPYHQAIGFYLERAGNYEPAEVNLLCKLDRRLDFYLSHNMGETDYSANWRIHYPLEF
jgi:hypothetical protein